MGLPSAGQSRRNETLFDSVARYRRTGIATMPKLMAPRHIDRGMSLSSICRLTALRGGEQTVVCGLELGVAQEDDVCVLLRQRRGLAAQVQADLLGRAIRL